MANPSEQARRDANNGKTGIPPSSYNQNQQAQYRQAFQDQQSKNGKK